MLALSALVAAAFVACGAPDPTTTTTSAGGGTATSGSAVASTGTSGGAVASTGTGGSAVASTGTGGSLTPEEQVDKFCQDVIAPFCEALFACCADPAKLDSAGKTVAGCKTKLAMECNAQGVPGIVGQLKAGNTALDEARLAACVSSLTSMKAGGATCVRPPWFVLQLDCISAFQGIIPPGGACNPFMLSDQQFIPCKDGSCDLDTCIGFLATGAACDPSKNDSGAAGCNYVNRELCIGTGTTGTCGLQGEIGDPCYDAGKNGGFSCKSMSCGPGGKCIAPTAAEICVQG